MTATPGADRRQHAAEAFEAARRYHAELREIYRYYMPYRLPTFDRAPGVGGGREGERRTDVLFDATGVAAAYNFSGTLQADWMPLNQPFFRLEAGPLIPPGDQRKMINEMLASQTAVIEGVVQARVPPHVHEFGFDLFAGTAAMTIAAGGDSDLIRPMVVPAIELALEDGPWGDVWHIWWKRRYRARDVPQMWPRGKISDHLARLIRQEPRQLVDVVQYTYYDLEDDAWHLCVWCEADQPEHVIWTERFRVSPWIVTRFFKVPGECFGRGLGHLGLPFVKTANKTRELALTAAAMAVMGIFLTRNDGVFNAENSVFKPLALWPVASTGGPLGPTISRLEVPKNFDVTSIVMQEERDQIRKVTIDDELPPDELAVRSATEVAGRLRRYARRWGGVNTRLGAEWIVPTVRRTADVLDQKNILPLVTGPDGRPARVRISADQLLQKVTVIAPAMAAQKAERVESAVNWLQMMSMLFGPQAAAMVAKVNELLPEMGRWLAVDERFINSQADIEKLQAAAAQMMAAKTQAEAGPPAPPEPGQQYVNGGGMLQ